MPGEACFVFTFWLLLLVATANEWIIILHGANLNKDTYVYNLYYIRCSVDWRLCSMVVFLHYIYACFLLKANMIIWIMHAGKMFTKLIHSIHSSHVQIVHRTLNIDHRPSTDVTNGLVLPMNMNHLAIYRRKSPSRKFVTNLRKAIMAFQRLKYNAWQ